MKIASGRTLSFTLTLSLDEMVVLERALYYDDVEGQTYSQNVAMWQAVQKAVVVEGGKLDRKKDE